jgi:TolB-like protein/Flp pilus assembly protein TadD
MAGPSSSSQRIRFGVFEVDLQAGELYRQGRKLHLYGKPFQVLTLLLEHVGELVTREELQKRLWPEDTFIEFDDGLNHAIKKLRDTLGDSAHGSRFIETLPRRGYRFLGPIERLAGSATLARAETPKLAVLPFENLSGDPDQEYFSDGLTEEMITQLARLLGEWVGVIARMSSMLYKGTPKGIAEIGRELGVDHIIEGTVRRDANRVRVSAQLIRVSDQTHLWAENYDRDLTEILALQAEVAQAIAREIQIKLTPEEEAQLGQVQAVNREAYQAYLKGRFQLNMLMDETARKAVEFFQQALKIDPSYAPAHAGIAWAYIMQGGWGGRMLGKEAREKAIPHALKALELDDKLSEAHGALGMIKFFFEWDWAGAEQAFRRAMELNQSSSLTSSYYGLYLCTMGRAEEAVILAQQAEKLDPLAPITYVSLGISLNRAGRYEDSVQQCLKGLEVFPDFYGLHTVLGLIHLDKGKYDAAIAEYEKSQAITGGIAADISILGQALALAGREQAARKLLRQLEQAEPERTTPVGLAVIYAGLGEKRKAIEWLEKACEERTAELVWLSKGPMYASLRRDPDFQRLLRTMNFPS